jgi:hypothetical protein
MGVGKAYVCVCVCMCACTDVTNELAWVLVRYSHGSNELERSKRF